MAFTSAEWTIIALQALLGGFIFLFHGRREFNIKKNMQWFKEQGYPAITGVFQSFSEIVAALLVALGVYPRVFALVLMISMLGAQHYHWKRGDPWMGERELSLFYLGIAAIIAVWGVGWLAGI